MTTEYGLGRLPSKDERDANFLLRAVMGAPTVEPLTGWRYWWDGGYWGNQGQTPQCVGYAWAHWIEDSPVTHTSPGWQVDPTIIYDMAQQVDEWPGTSYDGTSVRAGAKVLKDQNAVAEYRWAFDVDTVARAVRYHGPVVMGSNWYDSMFNVQPEKDALGSTRQSLVITPGAALAGGHAYVFNGVNIPRRTFRVKNSWGRNWGVDGRATVSFDTVARLLKEDGEACMAIEHVA
jgi:hypothetical protein